MFLCLGNLDGLVQRRLELRAQYKMKCSLMSDKKTQSMVRDTANRLYPALIQIIGDQGIYLRLAKQRLFDLACSKSQMAIDYSLFCIYIYIYIYIYQAWPMLRGNYDCCRVQASFLELGENNSRFEPK